MTPLKWLKNLSNNPALIMTLAEFDQQEADQVISMIQITASDFVENLNLWGESGKPFHSLALDILHSADEEWPEEFWPELAYEDATSYRDGVVMLAGALLIVFDLPNDQHDKLKTALSFNLTNDNGLRKALPILCRLVMKYNLIPLLQELKEKFQGDESEKDLLETINDALNRLQAQSN